MKKDFYKNTLKVFKKVLKYNRNIKEDTWNRYARINNLFSSETLKAKEEVESFEDLKKKHSWF